MAFNSTWTRLLSPGTLLLNCPIRGIVPILNRPPINTSNGDGYYETLVERRVKADKNYDALRNYYSFPVRSTVPVQREDRDYGSMAQ